MTKETRLLGSVSIAKACQQVFNFQMMRRFVLLGMFCTPTAWAAADPPFAPNANAPDYVVTMIERPAVGTMQRSLTVAHHGDWTRVDTIEGDSKTTDYFAGNGSLQIRVAPGDGAQDRVYINVTLRPQVIGWDTAPRNTGERETFLGESCTVWNVKRSRPSYSSSNSEQLSCLTDDGIELWHRFVGKYGISFPGEATRIERRPIAADEVQPPQNLLALGWWSNEPKASSAIPDFEAVLEVRDAMRDVAPEAGKQTIRTIRRHYPWTYDEVRAGGTLRRLTISDASGRLRLWFAGEGAGAERLLAISPGPLFEQPASATTLKDTTRGETILGEQCHWLDLMPGAADAGKAECRTDDGIPLKQSEGGVQSGLTLSTAVSLARRPLTLNDVKPPNEILSLDWWLKEVVQQGR